MAQSEKTAVCATRDETVGDAVVFQNVLEGQDGATVQIFPVEFFSGREFDIEPDMCFVIMPFTQPWSNRTFAIIRETVTDLGYRCIRADDVYGKVVLSDIWEHINRAAFVVADLSAANPNVYYELGIAHTVGKDIIPILQVGSQIPFDQQPFRVLFYEDNRDGEAVLRKRLPEWIAALDYSSSPQMLIRKGRVDSFNQWRSANVAPNLTRCDFEAVRVEGIDLSGSFLSETTLARAHMARGDFRDAIMIRCVLLGANMSDCNLAGANLSEARLERADLSTANLSESILIRARLDGALLNGANVSSATIDYHTLEKYRPILSAAEGFDLLVIESG